MDHFTVNGSRYVLPRGSVEFRPGRIRVVIGDPIDTAGYGREMIGELMARTRVAIESNLSVDT